MLVCARGSNSCSDFNFPSHDLGNSLPSRKWEAMLSKFIFHWCIICKQWRTNKLRSMLRLRVKRNDWVFILSQQLFRHGWFWFDPNVNVKSKKAHWRFVSCQNLAERKLNGVFGQLMLTFTCSGLDNATSCRSLLEHITLKLHSSLINQIKINHMQRYWIEARGPLFKDHKTKSSCFSLFFFFLFCGNTQTGSNISF